MRAVAEDREGRRRDALDVPRESRQRLKPRVPRLDGERFGRLSEAFARFMGTPQFLLYMTLFCVAWIAWNTLAPVTLQFDPKSLNYTLLTLILSLQASYAAPLILLAQNRQDDRDRVGLEQDRQRAERNLADTEYLAREVAALRLAVSEVATRDFVRSELRTLLEELELLAAEQRRADDDEGRLDQPVDRGRSTPKARAKARRRDAEPPAEGAPEHLAEQPTEHLAGSGETGSALQVDERVVREA
ncbi:DUF1003 domain-containing protein [Quadrisphaera setariae]|uniref:DUF1003 domain-containing protein n=1 Tax=Quadrisphaera setariae TaxID=2593304 RepID=A0A5C8ZBS7_9ACTN|nr:DUF1003 domain-containing protein [Quadrisphaera setariae]TXR55227.1 DUF1003 domain-containing protein [Quadrisphaera setariae]